MGINEPGNFAFSIWEKIMEEEVAAIGVGLGADWAVLGFGKDLVFTARKGMRIIDNEEEMGYDEVLCKYAMDNLE